MSKASKILLVLTGGTICSFGNEQGTCRDVDSSKAKLSLLRSFEQSDSEYSDQEFEVVTILDTLSENMTIPKWNELIAYLQQKELDSYRGIMIAHGTDTLAYMSSLLAILLSGLDKPVFLVSSQLPIEQEGANGPVNFRYSVELICRGIVSGVYVVYRNSDGKIYLHQGSHLESCHHDSDDFFSEDMIALPEHVTGREAVGGDKRTCGLSDVEKQTDQASKEKVQKRVVYGRVDLQNIGMLKSDVIWLQPYVGLDYRTVAIPEGIRVVLHGLYHSSTACVGATLEEQESPYSVLTLLRRCKEKGILFLVTPCPSEDAYVSGSILRKGGALPVYGMTPEMVYVKCLVAEALGYEGQELYQFVCADVCGEFVYQTEG